MLTFRAHRLLLILILAGSGLLRIFLCSAGGQYFFGDEGRYDRGVHLFRAIARGDFPSAQAIAAMPEHSLFVWVGAATSAVQRALTIFTGQSDWSQPENILGSMWLAAAVLSLFSTLNLYLVYRLARTIGAGESEALWALGLMAVSNTAFYYSRHLLPYDSALSAALAALLVGVSPLTPTRAWVCGLLGGACYGLYNGYWYLVPTIWLAHALACWREPWRARLRLSLWCTGGIVVALAAPLLLGTLVAGRSYWAALLEFSGTVKQGVFAEGWSLPWEFLWHSEGAAGVAVLLALLAAGLHLSKSRDSLPDRLIVTLLTLTAAYALLVIGSNGLARFVVYGRTVKPFLPALCLLGGWAIHRLISLRPQWTLPVIGLLLVAALAHFTPHFGRTFPREFKLTTFAHFGTPKVAVSFSGTMIPRPNPVTRPDLALVNAHLLYPLRAPHPLPEGTTILRAEHPMSYLPYQYEGYSPRERALIRSNDISMRVIKLAAPSSVPDAPPPSVLFGPQDFPDGRR